MPIVRRILGALKGRCVTASMSGPLLGGWVAGLRFVMQGPSAPRQRHAANFNGLPFILRWRDWPAVQEVMIEDEYGIVRDCLAGQESPLVVDLGANIGTFSLYVLKHFPVARVHAYEADADTFSVLSETRKKNTEADWTVHHAAAWKEDGAVSFEATAFSTGSRVSVQGTVQVPAKSLASIFAALPEGPVALLKADIEGAEEAVLGGQEALLARVENLIVELHPGRCDTDAVVRTLRAVYPHVQAIPGRRSSKPLLLASRTRYSQLPLYQG